MSPTVVMVPGLRGDAPEHWQQLMTPRLDATHLPTGRPPLDLEGRVANLATAVESANTPVLIVAHSAGVLTLVHWAASASERLTRKVGQALLVTPPVLDRELPDAYPRLADLQAAGWLPVPEAPLPCAATVLVSDDDPLGPRDTVAARARRWGAQLLPVGAVGHANPASGHGEWPLITSLIADLLAA